MPLLKTDKDIRWVVGWLQYITLVISNLIIVCEPIFNNLKKVRNPEWDEACQEALHKIIDYLANPPILVPLQCQNSLSFVSYNHQYGNGGHASPQG